jgi:hypothetical protein
LSVEEGLFAFERDASGSLRCIPMVVRFKLDRVGVKLALQQWRQLKRAERARLVLQPCASYEEVSAYRARLIANLLAQNAQLPELFSPDPSPDWSRLEVVADSVAAWCVGLGLSPPGAACWARLSPLQRFTLTKLSRSGHKNDNFLGAMVEFGLLEAPNG